MKALMKQIRPFLVSALRKYAEWLDVGYPIVASCSLYGGTAAHSRTADNHESRSQCHLNGALDDGHIMKPIHKPLPVAKHIRRQLLVHFLRSEEDN